jgi:cystathionine beta-lyase/cystathionine gamma-synthase
MPGHATKYLNGDFDVVGGAVVPTTDELSRKVQLFAQCHGDLCCPLRLLAGASRD